MPRLTNHTCDMPHPNKEIVLVYNADSGMFNAFTDTIHKVVSPSTYDCRLCRYTFSTTGMLRKWRDFLQNLPVKKSFLHRNQFRAAYPHLDLALPAILTKSGENLELLISAEEINSCQNLEELIDLVDDRCER